MSDYLCNLLVPGAAKSGTSSLHELLDQHPRISMSVPKEPHYFAIDEKFSQGSSYHNSLFENKIHANFFGESSTLYMPNDKAIRRISQNLRDPKIIFLLRDPVQRSISHYRWRYRLGHETRPPRLAFLESGYGLPDDLKWGGNYKSYLQFSNYSHYIPMWQSVFGLDNVLLLRNEDLKKDHQKIMDKCFEFLGLERHIIKEVSANKTSEVTRVVSPDWLEFFDKKIPLSIQKLFRYRGIRRRILRYFTQDSPYVLTENDISWLRLELADDIKFFESLGNTK